MDKKSDDILILHPEDWKEGLGEPEGCRLVSWEDAQREGRPALGDATKLICLPLLTYSGHGNFSTELRSAILDLVWEGGAVLLLVPDPGDEAGGDVETPWSFTTHFIEVLLGIKLAHHENFEEMEIAADLPPTLRAYMIRAQPRFYENPTRLARDSHDFVKTLGGCPVWAMAVRWDFENGEVSAAAHQWGDGVIAILPGPSGCPQVAEMAELLEIMDLIRVWGQSAWEATLTGEPWIKLPPGATPPLALEGDLKSVVLALLKSRRRDPDAYITLEEHIEAKGNASAVVSRLKTQHGYSTIVSARSERADGKRIPKSARGYRIVDWAPESELPF